MYFYVVLGTVERVQRGFRETSERVQREFTGFRRFPKAPNCSDGFERDSIVSQRIPEYI